ncbi:quinol:electron acceptor oxidoreductase subunit ActD [Sphingomonas sp.]|uniref:quinol:electron acceptor oxidoreductase subunit ActD n=1 Tax=Sphingomonas sp. TaxID=28214 RepID=UPI003AFFAB53
MALASFADEAAYRAGVARAGEEGRRIIGLWTPYPVEMAATPGRHGIIAMAATIGLVSAALFVALEWWTAAVRYRFDAGGRPFADWVSFLVAPVEAGALAAGIAAVVMLIVRARLTRLHHPAFALEEVERAQRDRFVIALTCDEGEDANAAIALLTRAGAVHSRLVSR